MGYKGDNIMDGYIKEYLDLGATPERIAELEEEFRKPVRQWEKKFILGMPYGDTITNAKQVIPQMCYYARNGVPIMTYNSQFVDIQRNEFALATLKENFDYLIMLDIDQENGRDVIEKFAAIAYLRPDVEVVSGNVATRTYPHFPAWYYQANDGEKLVVPTEWEEDKGLIRVGFGGTGAMMIKKEALQVLPFPWFQYDYTQVGAGEYIREDTYFNNICRENGVKVWVDPNMKIGHYMRGKVATVDVYKDAVSEFGLEYLLNHRKR